MGRKRKYVWFVKPLDASTNEAISREVPEENFQHGVLCADGLRRNLWGCSFQIFSALQKSRRSLNLKFRAFNRCGNGKIRECDLLYKKRRKSKAKTA